MSDVGCGDRETDGRATLESLTDGIVEDRDGEQWFLFDRYARPLRYAQSQTWGGGVGRGSITAEKLAPWRQITVWREVRRG